MTDPARTGLLLFAHGARDPRWAEPFERVAARVRAARPEARVRLAFLEFMAPDLPAAADALVQGDGCTRLEVLPLFLGVGGHVRRDLPELLAQVRQRHPQVPVALHPAAGECDAVVDAMAAVAAALLGAAAPGADPPGPRQAGALSPRRGTS